jgi:nitrous oxidase accessory protein
LKPLSVFILFFLLIQVAIAETIIVCPKCKNTSIQKAVESANANDTILIKKGNYKEKFILIKKPLTLIGEDFPSIDAEGDKSVIQIQSSNVKIIGLNMLHSGNGSLEDYAGIKVIGVENVLIENNKLIDNFFGIYLSGVSNSIVRNNTISGKPTTEQGTGNGIHLWKCENIKVENNLSKGHRDGIYFEFVTNTHITNNISERNIRYGLHFMFSHDNSYQGNTFRYNGAGVAVMFTHGVTMQNNIFRENWGGAAYGLLLKEISDSKIVNNIFEENTIALHMEGTNRIIVENNQFKNNGWAVRIQSSSMDNEFKSNNFFGNTFDVSTNGTLVLNKFNSNYWDKYEGYDLNKDKIGDVPFRPVSMYSMVVEQMPYSMILYRSFMVTLMDRIEKVVPSLIPVDLVDEKPRMKPFKLGL